MYLCQLKTSRMLFGPLHIALVVFTGYAIKWVQLIMIMTMIMMIIIRCVPHTLIMKMIIRCVHLDSPCVHQVCPPHLDGLPLFLLHRQRHVLGGIALYYISVIWCMYFWPQQRDHCHHQHGHIIITDMFITRSPLTRSTMYQTQPLSSAWRFLQLDSDSPLFASR